MIASMPSISLETIDLNHGYIGKKRKKILYGKL